ncbi:murein biosynthesis integral membrane protein MurJ [Actinomadura barringtoniae]|uniref:Murein biosynthesis integral membrane protein MurJ n=2 Tax=Actinomadura barringtoniae TaxID=1427535 RepID=A0A939T907_9ACTN|nr:murein biosynthesis integral membrane protein MurJ [Actinomadura barringtoniae]
MGGTAERDDLVRAGRAMAIATVASRATGFLRVLAMGAAIGLSSGLASSYTAANTFPNALFELLFGGALASVMVPLLVRAAEQDRAAGDLYARRLLSLVIYLLGAATLVAVLLAPQIVSVYAVGFHGAQREAAIGFTRFFLPQIFFYGMSAALAAVLNARGKMTVPMWAPAANNLVVIATAGVYLLIGGTQRLGDLTPAQSLVLSIGTTGGVIAQMLVLAWASRRAGFRLRPKADPRGIGVRRILRLAGWTLTSVLAAQAAVLCTTRLMSKAAPGAIAVYGNAYTLFQLPYAVIAVTVMTGMLPRMSRAAAGRDLAAVTADLSRSLRLTGVVLLPVAAALVLLGPQITTVLFGPGGAAQAGPAVAVFGVALVPFAAYQIMMRTLAALQDTRTQALIGITVAAVTATGALTAAHLVHGPLLVAVMAGCSATGYTAGALIGAHVLRRKLGRIDGHRLATSHARMSAAVIPAALASLAVLALIGPAAGDGRAGSLATLAAVALAGAGLYAAASRWMRVPEFGIVVGAFPFARHR